MNVWYINSILGAICLEEENDALCGVHFCPDGAPELEPLPRRVVETPLLQEAEGQLNEYFAGVRREFDLPLAPAAPLPEGCLGLRATDPYGEILHHGQLAAAAGALKGCGQSGRCLPLQLLSPLQPCHRVVGSTGKLTGYAYGVEMKQYLLELEQQE